MGESAGPRVLNIKKYPNRRYYDATRSRHVTFEEIYGLVRDGYDVQITDSKSGDDITAKVLAQLIIELDPLKLGVFPVPLLHGLLRATPQAMTDYARRYWAQMFGSMAESQRDVGQYVRRMMGLPAEGFTPAMADWARMMWGAGAQSPVTPTPPAAEGAEPPGEVRHPPAASDAPRPEEDPRQMRRELEELGRRMESLRRRLGAGSPAKKPRRRPKR
jgi:polyhydroxyalkanoate synthesis repressor PhaR